MSSIKEKGLVELIRIAYVINIYAISNLSLKKWCARTICVKMIYFSSNSMHIIVYCVFRQLNSETEDDIAKTCEGGVVTMSISTNHSATAQ